MGLTRGRQKPFKEFLGSEWTNIYRSKLLEASRRFSQIAESIALESLRAHVPFDTQNLKHSIESRPNGHFVIIEVPDAVLTYDKGKQIRAKALAAILEIGIGEAGQLLHRTRSNTAKGTKAGMPTKDWFKNAKTDIRQKLIPVAKELVKQAVSDAIREANRAI
jgi:hypothetical protein